APRFIVKENRKPSAPAMTANTHSGLFLLESVGRCPETARKKMRKAISSSPVEKGNRSRQCHRETNAHQCSVTPDVHNTQQVQGTHKPNFLVWRSFGMEWKPMPRMNVPIQPKI